MQKLLHKFDRWVHEPSGRSYHLVTSPPRTISDERKPSIPMNMIDDITGEPLTKVYFIYLFIFSCFLFIFLL